MTTEFKQGDIVRHKSTKLTPNMVVNEDHPKNDKTIYCTYYNTITGAFIKQQFDSTEIEHTKP